MYNKVTMEEVALLKEIAGNDNVFFSDEINPIHINPNLVLLP